MNKKTLLAVIVVLIVIAGVIYLAPSPAPAAAQGTGANKATGYAWSSNIGWLAFGNGSGDQYGVTYDDQGKFSGYAWSSNIGWVNFNPDASAAPSNPKLAACWGDGNTCSNSSTSGDTLTGWARACSVFAAGCTGALKADSARGGWDGWIKLAKGSGDTGGAYAVKRDLTSGVIAGYAWGSDIVGWLQFKFRDNGSPIDPGSGCAVDPSQCTVGGGGCNPNEGTCGGSGGGLNVTCSTPAVVDPNTDFSLTANVANGTAPYVFVWNDGTPNTSGGTPTTHTYNSGAGPTKSLTVNVTDNNNQTGVCNQVVTVGASTCGNGAFTPATEQCDASASGWSLPATCPTGFSGTPSACSSQCKLDGCTPNLSLGVSYSSRDSLFINFQPSGSLATPRNTASLTINADPTISTANLSFSRLISNDPGSTCPAVNANTIGLLCKLGNDPSDPVPCANLTSQAVPTNTPINFTVQVPDNTGSSNPSLLTPPAIKLCNNYSIYFREANSGEFTSAPIYLDYVPSNITQN